MVLTGTKYKGFYDRVTNISGPLLTTGDELASAASTALGEDLKFEDISEYVPSGPTEQH
jgi:hypothetical protein